MISGLIQVFVGIRIDELTKRGEIDVLMAQKLNSIVLGLMSQGQWHPLVVSKPYQETAGIFHTP